MAHLITGYAGYAHIKSADEGSLNASVFGNGQYVMELGNQFEGSIIDNNTVRILDGDGLMYGRHFRIEPNTYEDLTITTGTAGKNRIDLICMTYEKNADDETERVYLQVIKGSEVVGTPSVPKYTNGNILEGASINQMPLYKVKIEGVVLSSINRMFEVIPSHEKIVKDLAPKSYNGLDFNDIVDSGLYGGASSPQVVGATNYPVDATGFLQVSNSGWVITQTYFSHNGKIFTRSKYYSFDWSTWTELIKGTDVVDNLLSDRSDLPLSAKQGAKLNSDLVKYKFLTVECGSNGVAMISADDIPQNANVVNIVGRTANRPCMGFYRNATNWYAMIRATDGVSINTGSFGIQVFYIGDF